MKISDHLHAFLWRSMSANNCNTYLIDGPARVLIDPGHLALFDHVRSGLSDLGLTPNDIDLVICTHAHPDHIEAVTLFKQASVLFALHAAEWELIQKMRKYLGPAMEQTLGSISPDLFLREGDLNVKDLRLDVVHTPGHSPGSVTLYWSEYKALFTGDVIFNQGIGRTDLPGGNGPQLKASIKRLADLDVEMVLSGHGDMISGAEAVKRNFEHIERVWFGYI
jgi:hydroxyacylglutathione hydrolase